jgi:hypothetical protein
MIELEQSAALLASSLAESLRRRRRFIKTFEKERADRSNQNVECRQAVASGEAHSGKNAGRAILAAKGTWKAADVVEAFNVRADEAVSLTSYCEDGVAGETNGEC